jgi:transcriptional regulator with XRE-family HTH domain
MSSVHTARYQEFLERLKAARKEAGLTQAVVAERLGRPQSFVANSESGERRVDVVELAIFAELYGNPLGYFLDAGKGRHK